MACINNIGCFSGCDPIELFPAKETGEHVIQWWWLGVSQTLMVDGSDGEALVLPNIFNEHSMVNFSIQTPGGQYYDSEGELADDPVILQMKIK